MPVEGKPAAAATASAAAEAVAAAEDVAVLRALAAVGLTRAQLAALLPAVQSAQARLAALEQEEAAKLAALRGSLEQAKRDVLAGKGSGASAEGQFALAQSAAAQRRARLRADLVASLRRALQSILTPAQVERMAQSGQAIALSQRTAGWRGGSGGRSERGSERTRQLDRVRQMSPAAFERENRRMADRLGGESSSRYRQYLAFMTSVRGMSHSQYLLQRDHLAAQPLARVGGGAGEATALDAGEAIHAFVDRYLLSPRAPVVVGERLRTP
jgi:hypothetical protein